MPTQANGTWIESLRQQRTASEKSWVIALLLSIFFGIIGADRFYLGRWELGILKLLTMGGLFAWWLIDIVLLLLGVMKDEFGREVQAR